MSNIQDEKPPFVKTIQFRVPEVLASAMQAEARAGMISVSESQGSACCETCSGAG
jgi:hypothetical protein